jgi:hypothetical protein
MKNRLIGIIILLILGGILSECSSADRNSEGTITTQGELDAFETQIGDCFVSIPGSSDAADVVEFKTLDAIPCTEAHRWQVVHKGYINNLQDYSESDVSRIAQEICESAYRDIFLSMSEYKFSEYADAKTINFVPTPKSWKAGDRTVDCLVGSDTTFYYTSALE